MKSSLSDPQPGNFCLQDILKSRAASGEGRLICYHPGDSSKFDKISYRELYTQAYLNSEILRALPSFKMATQY
jgi:hypothetical protein